jgi:hypothetical protein
MKSGIELIAQERKEQIEKHHRTLEKDVKINTNSELSFVAALFCAPNPRDFGANPIVNCPPKWDIRIFTKMINKPYKERLIIAGALIAAEIDRLNYKS